MGLSRSGQGQEVCENAIIRIRRYPEKSFGVELDGLTVTSVESGSQCDGLVRVGDVITAFNKLPLQDGKSLLSQEAGRVRESTLELQIRRTVLRAIPQAEGPARTAKVAAQTPPLKSQQAVKAAPAPQLQQLSCGQPLPPALRVASSILAQEKQAAAGPMVILNGEDLAQMAEQCPAFAGQPFAWQAVMRTIDYYTSLGFIAQVVCEEAVVASYPPPESLVGKIVQCPSGRGRPFGGSNRPRPVQLFVIRLAQVYNCAFVDNSNYRKATWKGHNSWTWLKTSGLAKKVDYIFDLFGDYVPSGGIREQQRNRQQLE